MRVLHETPSQLEFISLSHKCLTVIYYYIITCIRLSLHHLADDKDHFNTNISFLILFWFILAAELLTFQL